MVTINQLYNIMPNGKQSIDPYVNPLNAAMKEFNINTLARQAAFIAQIAHESAEFRMVEENLNYSEAGLLRVFPKYFNAAQARTYARQPQKIANRVYANRMGNGDESSGDGWKHRGFGLLQNTGKDGQTRCGVALGVDLANHPELLKLPENATRAAAWFWSVNGLNSLADAGKFEAITRRINGGLNGYEDRLTLWKSAKRALKV